MVDLQTAIDELNTGKIEFDYKDDDCCTTEGEVVILLKRLAELEKADFVEVVTCEKCAYRENCGQQIYLERSYTSIDWCSEGRKENRQCPVKIAN